MAEVFLARGSGALKATHSPAGAAMGGAFGRAGPSQGLGSGDLSYHGGPTMRTNTTYAIYWIPSGYSVSANYQSLKQSSYDRTGGNADRWPIAPGGNFSCTIATPP